MTMHDCFCIVLARLIDPQSVVTTSFFLSLALKLLAFEKKLVTFEKKSINIFKLCQFTQVNMLTGQNFTCQLILLTWNKKVVDILITMLTPEIYVKSKKT